MKSAGVVLGNRVGDHHEIEFRASCVDRAGTTIWRMAGRRVDMINNARPDYLESLWMQLAPSCTNKMLAQLPR